MHTMTVSWIGVIQVDGLEEVQIDMWRRLVESLSRFDHIPRVDGAYNQLPGIPSLDSLLHLYKGPVP